MGLFSRHVIIIIIIIVIVIGLHIYQTQRE